ncbi:MAG: hypothetical protein HFG28_15460 [Eubacterium sp.]|nr:hypothetical protein [Eubacterium sp.]
MTGICKFLKVEHGTGTLEGEDCVLVEECKEYDTALSDYIIVCDRKDLSEVLVWTSENMKDISDYIKGTFSGDSPAFGFTLIRSTLNINSFTQEFVKSCGSVQAFLDKYGVSPSLERSVEQAPEARTWTPGLTQDIGRQEESQPASIEMPESLKPAYGDDEEEPQDSFGDPQDEFEDVQDDFSDGARTSIFITDTIEDTEEEPVEEAPLVQLTEEEREPVDEQPPVQFTDEEEPEDTYFNSSKVVLNPDEVYGVECAGMDISALQFRNGKVIVPFSHLSELVSQVVAASSVIEQKDAEGFEILTNDSKFVAAKLVERYAPTVIKEFMLSYVRSAGTDAELVRITRMLDEFCNFVAGKKILSFGKEAI